MGAWDGWVIEWVVSCPRLSSLRRNYITHASKRESDGLMHAPKGARSVGRSAVRSLLGRHLLRWMMMKRVVENRYVGVSFEGRGREGKSSGVCKAIAKQSPRTFHAISKHFLRKLYAISKQFLRTGGRPTPEWQG